MYGPAEPRFFGVTHYLLGQTLSHKDARVVLVLEAKLIRIIIIKLVLFYDYHSTVHFIENRLTEIIFYFFCAGNPRHDSKQTLDFCAMMATVADTKSMSRTSD